LDFFKKNDLTPKIVLVFVLFVLYYYIMDNKTTSHTPTGGQEMKIISKRERVEITEYVKSWTHPEGYGFSFDCDENGVINEADMYPEGIANLRDCEAGKMEGYTGPRLQKNTRRVTNHAVGLCSCGRKLTLASFTNSCRCGREYNQSGQKLAPRGQWGDDTGESVSEILSIGHSTNF